MLSKSSGVNVNFILVAAKYELKRLNNLFMDINILVPELKLILS